METESKAKTTDETGIKADSKKVFWTRFGLWVLFSTIMPCGFIIWRYDLFKVTSKVQLGGWGFIAIIIAAVFCLSMWRYIKRAMGAKYSFMWQIVSGIIKICLPLMLLMLAVQSIQNSVEYFTQFMGVTIVCELIGIPLNPMPKWVYLKTGEAQYDVIDYYFKKKEEKEGK